MAKPKPVTVTVATDELHQSKADVLALGLVHGVKRLPREYEKLDKQAANAISQLIKLGDFTGKANETAVLYVGANLPVKRLLLVGLGDKTKANLETLRQAAGAAVRRAADFGAGTVALALHHALAAKIDPQAAGQTITEGVIVGAYNFDEYLPPKKKHSKSPTRLRATILAANAGQAAKLNRGKKIGAAVAQGQNCARMVANQPGNAINPPKLAREAQRLARQKGLRCKIFDERQLAAMKMNAILAVGAGSASKPRLIMLEHRGKKARTAAIDAVIVGKAVTFDSGGISLKPGPKMHEMMFDKTGGCAVLGIMAAVADLKLKLNVVGLLPSVENMPSQTSYRPGDILKTYSGKTVEVQNTDAEGRLILCDALAYAAKMKPAAIVDIATLTGACLIALGEHHAGLFANNNTLLRRLEKAGHASGEKLWHLPSGPEYLNQMKSKVADLRNIGGREGGSCTAAAFLGAFVGDIPWAHIDIAGVAYTDKTKPYRSLGATGFAVRLILDYLRQSQE